MVVEIKNSNLTELTLEKMPSNLLDVVGCKVRLNEVSGTLLSSEPIDAYTTSSAYTNLNNLLEDSSDGQDWLLSNTNTGAGSDVNEDENTGTDRTQVYCQMTHCYVSCTLTRPIYASEWIASELTNLNEDVLYYQGAELSAKGTYFAYDDTSSG